MSSEYSTDDCLDKAVGIFVNFPIINTYDNYVEDTVQTKVRQMAPFFEVILTGLGRDLEKYDKEVKRCQTIPLKNFKFCSQCKYPENDGGDDVIFQCFLSLTRTSTSNNPLAEMAVFEFFRQLGIGVAYGHDGGRFAMMVGHDYIDFRIEVDLDSISITQKNLKKRRRE